MSVKELIELLLPYPSDMIVVIPGYEGGVTEPDGVAQIDIELNKNKGTWYYGEHEEVDSGDPNANAKALQIS
jgi:hypothetical protein